MKSVLKSCSFGVMNGLKEIPPEVFALLAEMKDDPNNPVEYVEEVIMSAVRDEKYLQGFNLKGFIRVVDARAKQKQWKKAMTELHINFSGEGEDTRSGSSRQEFGCISADKVAYDAFRAMRDSVESSLEDSELKYAIETIQSLNEEFIVSYDVNLITLLRSASAGVVQAISKLREICQKFEVVAEQVEIILSSGVPVEECFADC